MNEWASDADVRAFVKQMRDEDFEGNLTHTARAIGISHAYLSQFLSGKTGAGKKLLRGLSALTGKSTAYHEHRNTKPESGAIPMLIWCPMCHARHIDVGEFATKPHHTHSCQACGLTWRPAIVPTVGVEFLPGFKNDAEASP